MSAAPNASFRPGDLLRGWIRDNAALNWLTDDMQRQLARGIMRDRHFNRWFDTVAGMKAGRTPDKADYLQIAVDIATESRLGIPANGTVLFSGTSEAAARRAVLADPSLHTNHRTPATAMLELLETFGKPPTPLETREERYLPWNLLSARLAREARGDVRIIVDNPEPTRTLRRVELAPLLANARVTSINGADKQAWAGQITGQFDERAALAEAAQIIDAHRAGKAANQPGIRPHTKPSAA